MRKIPTKYMRIEIDRAAEPPVALLVWAKDEYLWKFEVRDRFHEIAAYLVFEEMLCYSTEVGIPLEDFRIEVRFV
jgi:hypothetical protein